MKPWLIVLLTALATSFVWLLLLGVAVSAQYSTDAKKCQERIDADKMLRETNDLLKRIKDRE